MKNTILSQILQGNNTPTEGIICFDSSDHIRFQHLQRVAGNNYGCYRRITIEKNIQDKEGYTVTIYNLDGYHPQWSNNIQMAPKQMKIVGVNGNSVEMRGFGYDENAIAMGIPPEDASFENYGIVLTINYDEITRVQLNMYDRDIRILYLK